MNKDKGKRGREIQFQTEGDRQKQVDKERERV